MHPHSHCQQLWLQLILIFVNLFSTSGRGLADRIKEEVSVEERFVIMEKAISAADATQGPGNLVRYSYPDQIEGFYRSFKL